MARIRAGNRHAYRTLLERHWAVLVVYATGITNDKDLAEDVVQSAFIRVWVQRESWTPSGSVSAFLYRITRNLALNANRDRSAEMGRREKVGNEVTSRSYPPRPDEELALQRLQVEVRAAIESLPPRRREAFELSRFHGLSYQDIAETMEISPQTVANQLQAALAELRVVLAHHLKNNVL